MCFADNDFNDRIKTVGDEVTVESGGGNDTIDNVTLNRTFTIPRYMDVDDIPKTLSNAVGYRSSIKAGGGDDSVNFIANSEAQNVTIRTEAGNDTVFNEGLNTYVDLGTGDNVINNRSAGATILAGNGNDSVNNWGHFPEGPFKPASNVYIEVGDGDNHIGNAGGSNITIKTGDGNDTIRNFVAENALINVGNDFIYSYREGSTVNGGEGVNLFVYTVGEGKDAIYDYEAQDLVSIIGATRDKISFVDKKDVVTISFTGDTKSKLTVNKLISSDTLTFKIGDETYTYGELPTGVTFDDNNKKTAIKIGATAANVGTIDLTGSDYVPSVVTLDGSAATGAIELIGNAKTKALLGGSYSSTLIGNSTKDIYTGGAGSDTFVYDGGKDVINNYNGESDRIVLDGVTSIDESKISWSVNSVVVPIGSDKLTLNAPKGQLRFVDSSGTSIYITDVNISDDAT